jgi:hypothetical protein
MFRRINVGPNQRGVKLVNGKFDGVLQPGPHNVLSLFGQHVEVEIYDLAVPEFEHPRCDLMLQESRAALAEHFVIVELARYEVGVVAKIGRTCHVLPPGSRQLYWREARVEVRIDRFDISREIELWRRRVRREECHTRWLHRTRSNGGAPPAGARARRR